MKNQLKLEDSPYLKQHENNPVDWLPWKREVLQKAKKEDKLIFLSIGYSTCHWCHVMAHESFKNEKIAKFLNENFISIKVDREELPHIDKYYQDIHYLLQKRGGGWPLSVVLLPDSRVIFAATYLPAKSRQGMMGFLELLTFLQDKFVSDKDELLKSADSIVRAYENFTNYKQKPQDIKLEILGDFIKGIKDNLDEENHGIGSAPKFPHASTFDTLLDVYMLSQNEEALQICKNTANAMAKGGIYDQIEGGFYRYSVDERWQIPHFEKMLYTNAELLSFYSKLYHLTKDENYAMISRDIVEAINERFLQDNMYLSASDADSQKEEGKYFVFNYKEALEALKDENISEKISKEILEYLGITEKGNFENNTSNPFISSNKPPKELKIAKKILKKLRSKIEYPFIDTKILTSWNALFISALFHAGKFVDEEYTKMALTSLETLLNALHVNDVLYHQVVKGSSLKVLGGLEDYAYLSETLLLAYEASCDEKYKEKAKKLIYEAKEKFYKNGKWYMSDDEFMASAPIEDTSYKSAASCMMSSLATLSLLEYDNDLYETLTQMLALNSGNLGKYPHIYPELLKVWLKVNKGEILLKVPKTLEKNKTLLNYPYIFKLTHEGNDIEACNINNCFEKENSMSKIVDKIKDLYFGHL